MMRKRIVTVIVFISMVSFGFSQKKPMKEFVEDLMAKMTLQEKIGQLNLLPAGEITTGSAMDTKIGALAAQGSLGAILNLKGCDRIKALQEIAVKKSRLGIPLLVGLDVVHGYETIFPIPLGLSCSWNLDAAEEMARISAKEATADGINWTYSPMVDVAPDARWGRIAEGNGEDPFLSGCFAAAMIRGYQGNYGKENMMACLKHYALYGAVEAGKEYNTVDMSRARMYNQFLLPYQKAVEAGVGSVMTSFNLVDGVPATANRWLVTDLLRNDWRFNGFVVTDYSSISEILNHGTATDLQDASVQSLKAGTDMDMCAQGFVNTLEKSVKEGKVSVAEIDAACRRVLEAKYTLGLFADPYKYCDLKRRKKDIFTEENRQAARNIAAETFVLLKNENDLLPLKKTGTIALIGPLANSRANMAGCWTVAYTPDLYPTLKESLERAVDGKAKVIYAQGCNVDEDEAKQKAYEWGRTIPRGNDAEMKTEALEAARNADVIVCAMGETSCMTGESSSRTDLETPRVQRELLVALLELGKPIVMLNFAGRPTVLKWEQEHIPAILNVWFGGSEAAPAICDVLFGDKVPCGRLTVSMPQSTGQEPLYYNHLNTGRPVPEGTKEYRQYQSNYLDVRNDPLYPFGFGLSYTNFEYSELQLSASTMQKNGDVTATIRVANTGKRDAYEVVQLYIRDLVASVSRPVKELKAFQRVFLKSGESREVSFKVTSDMLKYYDNESREKLDAGDFIIMVGPNSRDLKTQKLTLQ